MKKTSLVLVLSSLLSATGAMAADSLNWNIECTAEGSGHSKSLTTDLVAKPGVTVADQRLESYSHQWNKPRDIEPTLIYTINTVVENSNSIVLSGTGRVSFPGGGSLSYDLTVKKNGSGGTFKWSSSRFNAGSGLSNFKSEILKVYSCKITRARFNAL